MNEVVIKVIGNYSYQTSRCLGEGVYGKVYEGTQRQTKQKVAIKKIDLATFTNDKYLQNAIFSQIYLLKRFNHVNIVKFKDVLSSKNSLYIITQYCKNGDLKQLIKRKRFKQEEVFQVIKQIVNGFVELVKEKIIHRDLKPANILINDGIYKIGDFGFAKYVDNFGSQMLKSCVGSPIYMAPQILQRTQYSTKCDIWSMGIIFYQMIFGYPPWKARDEYELLRGIKTIGISQIIKRQNLSNKASDFLKKTLAYSQQERISWSQLFDMFNPKQETKNQSPIQSKNYPLTTMNTSGKQRARITSSNWNTNLQSVPSKSSNNINNPSSMGSTGTATSNNQNSVKTQIYLNNREGNSSPLNSPDRRRTSIGNNYSLAQMEAVTTSRQFCIYYSFFCTQLFIKYSYVRTNLTSSLHDNYMKLLLSLITTVKNRSTLAISNVTVLKESKSFEELNRKMKNQHQSYDMLYNQIVAQLEKQGCFKRLKEQLTEALGKSDVINDKKVQQLQGLVTKIAYDNAQSLSQQVKKRGKHLKDYDLVQTLDFVLEVLGLCASKNKNQSLKQLRDTKCEQEDLKDYLSKVIAKVERISVSV